MFTSTENLGKVHKRNARYWRESVQNLELHSTDIQWDESIPEFFPILFEDKHIQSAYRNRENEVDHEKLSIFVLVHGFLGCSHDMLPLK